MPDRVGGSEEIDPGGREAIGGLIDNGLLTPSGKEAPSQEDAGIGPEDDFQSPNM